VWSRSPSAARFQADAPKLVSSGDVVFEPDFIDAVEIGRGAFSTVYRAVSADLGRAVAIKLFTTPADDADSTAAFERECAAVGQLAEHPAIVRIHGTGRTTDGRPYLIMQLYPLGSLAGVVQRDGPLTLGEVVYVGTTIGEALTSAHISGLVHRDVKPHNVLLAETGAVVLTDFGVARPGAQTTRTTATVATTHAFAAPELLRDGRADQRSDLYALAATLYSLLTGVPPHPLRPGEPEVRYLERIIKEPAPVLPATVPPALADVIRRGLASDPADRHVDVGAFARDLLEAASSCGVAIPTTLRAHTPPVLPAGASGTTATVIRPVADDRGSARKQLRLPIVAAVATVAVVTAGAAVGLVALRPDAATLDQDAPKAASPAGGAFRTSSLPTPTPTPTPKATAVPAPPDGGEVTAPWAPGATSGGPGQVVGAAGSGTQNSAGSSGGGTASRPWPSSPTPSNRPKANQPGPIRNDAPWVRGPGPFDVGLDCGGWRGGTDVGGGGGVQIRTCARRVGQIVSAGLSVRAVDGDRHRVRPDGQVWTCVGGPWACDDVQTIGQPWGPEFTAQLSATVGPGDMWTVVTSMNSPWGPHRCIGSTAILGGGRAVSPFRLDWDVVRRQGNPPAGAAPDWTCPTPAI
jgi:serine/threonine protein kinase